MKFKSTWILVAIFAGLGAYVALVEEPSRRAAEKGKAEEGVVFPKLDPAKVREVSLVGPKGELRIRKEADGRWYLTAPAPDRADDSRVNALLADLKGLKAEKEIAPANADLQPFGLAKPLAALTVSDGSPPPLRLELGAENPSGDSRYFRIGGGPVRAGKSYAFGSLLADPREFRSKEILETFPWAKLKSVDVEGPGTKLRLVKSGAAWKLEAPVVADADPDAAGRLAEKLRWTKIGSFVEEAPARAAETFSKALTVRFTASGEKTAAVIQLAEVGDQVWGRREGRDAVFTVPKEVLEALRARPADLRRKKPVLVKTWSVRRVEVAADRARFVYEKSDGAWRREGSTVHGTESSALQEYLETLETSQALHIIDEPAGGAAFALDAPKATAKFVDADHGEQPLWVAEKDGKVYARAGSQGPVYEMPPEYVSKALALIRAAGEKTKAPKKADSNE